MHLEFPPYLTHEVKPCTLTAVSACNWSFKETIIHFQRTGLG